MSALQAVHANDWSTSVGWVSDYRVRGLSISNRQPAAMLDLSLRGDTGWALGAGVAALNRDAEGRRSLRSINLSQGWQWDADWRFDLALAHGHYPGSGARRAYNSDEWSATLAWRGQLNATLLATPNATRWEALTGRPRSGEGVGVEVSGRLRLAGPVALDTGLGVFTLGTVGARRSYGYGNVGLTAAVGPVQGFLSCIGNRAEQQGFAGTQRAKAAWVASLLWTL